MKTRLAIALSALLLAPCFVKAVETKLNTTDTQFIKEVGQGGMDEVKLATLGTQKAESAEVRAFAEQMVKDHTAANDELKALAASKSVELSASIDASTANAFKSLEEKKGADFDSAFMKDMLKDHKSTVSAFEKEEKNAQDGDLKTWVSKMLPTLRGHLDHAKGLQK